MILLKKTKLTELENKFPDVSSLATKTPLTALKITQANLVTKTNFDITVSNIDSKITANKSKSKSTENKSKELKKNSEK